MGGIQTLCHPRAVPAHRAGSEWGHPRTKCRLRRFESLRLHQKSSSPARVGCFFHRRDSNPLSSPSGSGASRREQVGTSAHEVPLAALRIPPSPPRRSKLCIACSDYLCLAENTERAHAAAPPFQTKAAYGLRFGFRRISMTVSSPPVRVGCFFHGLAASETVDCVS